MRVQAKGKKSIFEDFLIKGLKAFGSSLFNHKSKTQYILTKIVNPS